MAFRILLNVLLLSSYNLYSQDYSVNINRIDSIINYINTNENDYNLFQTVYVDGTVIKKKKFLGLINIVIAKGGFAETYIYKENVELSKLFVGTRMFLNLRKTKSTNIVKNYVIDNGKLCFYEEVKYYEQKDIQDSMIYEIEYYICDDKILTFKKQGAFDRNSYTYLQKILKELKIKQDYKLPKELK